MDLPSQDVHAILRKAGVHYLFHANSVRTSRHFLERRTLLSRGSVERAGLSQTAQETDDKDKALGLWDDVFFDTCNIHERAGRRNIYGPVSLCFGIDILLDSEFVSVTRTNPIHWADDEQDWFDDLGDLSANFDEFDFGQIVVKRQQDVPFAGHLNGIAVDRLDSLYDGKISYRQWAVQSLKESCKAGQVKTYFTTPNCRDKCTCVADYNANLWMAKIMFGP